MMVSIFTHTSVLPVLSTVSLVSVFNGSLASVTWKDKSGDHLVMGQGLDGHHLIVKLGHRGVGVKGIMISVWEVVWLGFLYLG